MKNMARILMLSVIGMLAISSLPAYAVKTFKSEAVNKSGENMYLFSSSAQDVKKEFCLNDVIPVYRKVSYGWPVRGYGEVQTFNEVGKIKISSYVGERDFKAQVVDGSVRVGDVAKKVGAYCELPVK